MQHFVVPELNSTASVLPAIVVGGPLIVGVLLLAGGQTLGIPQLSADLFAFLVSYILAKMSHYCDRSLDERLFAKWGRSIGTIMECDGDRHQNWPPKAHELSFLSSATDDDHASKSKLDLQYEFVYRRRLLGLKPVGLAIDLAIISACALNFVLLIPFDTENTTSLKISVIGAVSLFHAICLASMVTERSVQEALIFYVQVGHN